VERLSARSRSVSFSGHPAGLRRLARDARVVRTGLSGAAEVGADLVSTDRIEAYIRSIDEDGLIDDYRLEPAQAARRSVQLRVVRDLWPFEPDERTAPPLVVALDLLERSDERTKRSGRALLDRALGDRAR
jgi:hypothetical protein